mgnify:CR=1 FL=1
MPDGDTGVTHFTRWFLRLYNNHIPNISSEINGKRIPPAGPGRGTQLCLTNPDVLSLSVEQLKKDMVKPMTGLPLWADSLAYYWT